MKRYIKSATTSFDNLSMAELSEIISDPTADPDLLRDIIADTYEHSIRYDGTMILGLICNPNLSETDIPKEWVSDDLYQKSLVMDDDAPTWVLHKIFKENPRFLYSDGEPNIYMLDLVRNPNLSEDDRQILLDRYPYLVEDAITRFDFLLSQALTDEDSQNINDIIIDTIKEYPNITYAENCKIIGKTVTVVTPLIIIRRNAQMLGEALVETLQSTGYEVEDWDWDEV